MRAQVAADGPVNLAALALASWAQYLLGQTDHGEPIELAADPLLKEAVGFAEASVANPAAFLDFTAVFGTDLAAADRFAKAFADALELLRSGGIRSAIRTTLSEYGTVGGTSGA